jgi:nitrogen fixation-related uncharacterized protein
MSWNVYLAIIFLFGILFFASAVYALFWASRKGQLRDFEKGSRVIFDEDEPEGAFQDSFPSRRKSLSNTERPRKIQPEREGTLL